VNTTFFQVLAPMHNILPLIDTVLGYTDLILYLSEPELMFTVDQTKLGYKPFSKRTRFNNDKLIYTADIFTCGLSRSQTSTVNMVALLLNAEDKDDMTAAIITAIIRPTMPVGRMFNTSLQPDL